MSSFELPTEPVAPQPKQDARDLLARLYREIGVSAVAAALDLDEPEVEQKVSAEAKPVLRNEAA
jgi:hypothetical protein